MKAKVLEEDDAHVKMLITNTLPAVANAVFKASGIRLRNLPMTPEAVLKALKRV